MPNIHQILAGASVGDAITNFSFEIQRILIKNGFSSIIFAPKEHISKEYIASGKVKYIEELEKIHFTDDIILYHYSIGSKASLFYENCSLKKMICYHNITPAKYFKNISSKQYEVLENGRKQLGTLASITDVALAVSEYNRKELEGMNFKNTEVIPLVFPRDYLDTKPVNNLVNRFNDNKLNFIFVGRVVPNKKFEDLIKVFYYYNKTINSKSRMFLVGSYIGNEKYYTYLKSLIFDLGMTDSIIFSGHITTAELITYYKISHLFLCLSEHEGFGLPLIESMYFNIPVFALDHAAVSETLGNSGVLIKKLDYKSIAELINSIMTNNSLLNNIVANQHKRLQNFNIELLELKIREILSKYFKIQF
ncbi:MAG: hypothetical protein ACD_79C00727G0003 [uncultured bacterium]|nr:MAG: hypothetical protein ACD_79C00727G0003 [uncultured bacterium]